jgi:ribosome-associated protein
LRSPACDGSLPEAWCPGHAARFREVEPLSHSDPATGLSVGPRAARARRTDYAPQDLLSRVLASLDNDKAEDIVAIDLRGRSEMADHMVIASGRSSRQVAAISEKLVERLKEEFGILCKVEGKEAADWVLIDAGDVIVHVFRPEVRDFYQLEKMWLPAGARMPVRA